MSDAADGVWPWREVPGGVSIAIRLTPKGGRDAIEGIVADARGRNQLKVRVTAPPENGKANASLIALLAKTLKIPKSRIDIVSGATDRNKILRIAGATIDRLAFLDRQ